MNAKAKRGKPASYPEHQAYRGGCKVSWRYYKSKADALLASDVAAKEARRKAAQGYDFGYLVPGTWRLVEEGERAGLYEVVLP